MILFAAFLRASNSNLRIGKASVPYCPSLGGSRAAGAYLRLALGKAKFQDSRFRSDTKQKKGGRFGDRPFS
jgi:hypothetical protein